MRQLIEKLIARLWNRATTRLRTAPASRSLVLGSRIVDGIPSHQSVSIAQERRVEHIAVIGRTGKGKSRLLWGIEKADIAAGRCFASVDVHGDNTPFVLSTLAAEERDTGRDLSDRVIVIEPADPEWSVGLNPLEQIHGNNRFVQIAEFAQLLKQRWGLESFGARTDELLRNSLYVLAENGLTLLELALLLSHAAFRAECLKRLGNSEVRQFFELRFDQASEPMRATMREPILNKVSAFTADPHFRHIVGQQRSTFSILDAMDSGKWILLNLHKGKLGEQAGTLGSLFLASLKNALFARQNRTLYTVFCDEMQNLAAYDGGIVTMLSEARKWAVGVISSNQFLEQHSNDTRAAILAVGTHIFFQLSSPDAQQISTALDGGKPLAELLKNLPRRHMVVKTGHERWREVLVPEVHEPKVDPLDLYNRSRARWARRRTDIEQDIARRQALVGQRSMEALDDWE